MEALRHIYLSFEYFLIPECEMKVENCNENVNKISKVPYFLYRPTMQFHVISYAFAITLKYKGEHMFQSIL